MANSLLKPDSVEIYIPEAIAEDNITLYIIHLRVGRIEWTVRHRYRDFVEVRIWSVKNIDTFRVVRKTEILELSIDWQLLIHFYNVVT